MLHMQLDIILQPPIVEDMPKLHKEVTAGSWSKEVRRANHDWYARN